MTTVTIGGALAVALIGFAGPASASAVPVAHTWCPHSEEMHQTWDVNTGQPVICVNTGATGLMWVPDATR
ncbi:hypothetical protein GPX89_24785 [Nocardia sp. ET3-3]|uniref:Uncharacterized protein n=1 Tax=Nocardia terrae TaxID=2675851 RepID=A0A7K1V1U5_9NOCA|nr:hypothetical protein [Nocardia terrae]MVU80452.1 hypothetical protein [Nocardia terrae]